MITILGNVDLSSALASVAGPLMPAVNAEAMVIQTARVRVVEEWIMVSRLGQAFCFGMPSVSLWKGF
jgi:hypothetical protein